MKLDISKDWSIRMARLEGNSEIGAGVAAYDPFFDSDPVTKEVIAEESSLVFGKFVKLARRSKGLTVERMAQIIDIDLIELVDIEGDPKYRPEPRTVHQIANYLEIPTSNLLQVAGLTAPRDMRVASESVRFAARSEPLSDLSIEERTALEMFVAVLSEKK